MFPLPSELEEVYADAVERDQRLADLLLVDGWTALRWTALRWSERRGIRPAVLLAGPLVASIDCRR